MVEQPAVNRRVTGSSPVSGAIFLRSKLMFRVYIVVSLLALIAGQTFGNAQQPFISVHADRVLHRLTPYLTGACIEDVNHEVYGGIDSQMIFGESFAEPASQLPLKGFKIFGGRWTVENDGSLQAVGGNGSKMIWDGAALSEGEASVDVMLTEAGGGNGGLILNV